MAPVGRVSFLQGNAVMVKTAGPVFGPNVSGPIKRRIRPVLPYIPMQPHDLRVTGTLDPDVTGAFAVFGVYNEHISYKHIRKRWFIWMDTTDVPGNYYWRITKWPGDLGAAHWMRTMPVDGPVTGGYGPQADAVGIATVSLY